MSEKILLAQNSCFIFQISYDVFDSLAKEPSSMQHLKETYARDFPLKTIGGATAAKMQKPMWSCMESTETTNEGFSRGSSKGKEIHK
jgi:hypothetical protein